MKIVKFSLASILLLISITISAANSYDIVIVGGTPGGIMTAISAARMGKNVLILERTTNIGGLPSNGLGATDIATRGATTGLFGEFVNRIKNYYLTTYGPDSKQLKDCSDGYHFEPSVAQSIFSEMISECGQRITILTLRQFDCDQNNVEIINNKIISIKVINRTTKKEETYEGRIFIDATYEGDLGAAAGLPFRVGRESADEYNEIGAGKIYKYWDGGKSEGSTHLGDNAVQAYNYRLCLTTNEKNRIPFRKPVHYNREEYLSLIDDILNGNNTNYTMENVTIGQKAANRRNILSGGKTQIEGDVWGIAKLTNMVILPNEKTDANNQHLAFISTDLPEENWPWPTSSWEWRDKFSIRLQEYIEGLFWFAANDKDVPKSFRDAVSEWGYAADEYTDNNNFPRQVYVREGRRFEGKYFFTAKDALPTNSGCRPPLHKESITSSHYMLDSHATLKRERGRVHLDGFFSYPSAVYTVPYGVILPKKITNLILPVPVSGSHVGFSTLRMEPCWMALGQAAGTAASIAIDEKISVQDVPLHELQSYLIKEKATLVWFEDVTVDDPDFEMVQHMALDGYLSGWKANLDSLVDGKNGKVTRREQLREIYENEGTPITRNMLHNLTPHPRLLLLEGEEANIKKAIESDKGWKRMHEALIAECDKYISKKPVDKINGNSGSREGLKRIFLMSYAFRMTGDNIYSKKAEEEMLSIASLDSWPGEYLGIAEITEGMSIGYDWLYENLSQSSRDMIANAIIEKGIKPSMGPAGYHFLRAVSNWNLVCNTGMAIGSIATAEVNPELSLYILERSFKSLYMEQYAPSGNYPEGYGYWGYGTNNIVLLVDILQKCFGSDFGISASKGFMQTAESALHLVGNSGDCFNFSDTKPITVLNPASFFFASKNEDPSLLWNEKKLMFDDNALKVYASYRLSPAAIIWGSSIKTDDIKAPKSTLYTSDGLTPVALMRSGWEENDIYMGLKGGCPLAGHSHMDVGSFVLDAEGVRWATDFGSPSYTRVIRNGIDYFYMVDADSSAKALLLKPTIPYLKIFTQDDPRWSVPQASALFHNIITVNDSQLNIRGYAKIEKKGEQNHLKYAVTDLTSLYFNAFSSYKRCIAIAGNTQSIVRDELTIADNDICLRWALLTDAIVEIIGDRSVSLVKDGKRMLIVFDTSIPTKLAIEKTGVTSDFKDGFVGETSLITLSFNGKKGDSIFINASFFPKDKPSKIFKIKKINNLK